MPNDPSRGDKESPPTSSGTEARTDPELSRIPSEQLERSVRKQMDRLQALAEISSLLSSNWDVPLMFSIISGRIRRVLNHELASFLLYDPKADVLVRQAIDFPLGKGILATTPASGTGNPAERALKNGDSIIWSRADLQNSNAEISRSLVAEGMQSLCCVPMMRPNGPLGVLALASTRPNAFEKDDLGLLKQVAGLFALALENQRAASEVRELKRRLGEERKYLEGENRSHPHFPEIVGSSSGLRQVLDQVETVAPSEATVLILGETGTGKELIARAIHRLSRRANGRFIKLNCAAIPTGLLESELFGHEKGAFTGAISQKIGRMELADGGTLFLDEIGEIPLELQPKLLRVLQDHDFERLGSNRTIRVDVRLIAATNRDLNESIAQHQFRRDLYYRLSVFPVVLPALRERMEDIPLLVRHFVALFSKKMGRHIETIATQSMEALKHWSWPGNVRELENLMERSIILSEGSALRVPLSELRDSKTAVEQPSDQTLDGAERQHILRILRETGGKLSGPQGAAKRLGLKRTTLQSKMQRLKIRREEFSGPGEE